MNKKHGQGVVEYAGALVVAAIVVISVILIAPEDLVSNIFKMVQESVINLLVNGI